MIITTLALLAAQPAAASCELDGIAPLDLVALRIAILDQALIGTPRPATAQATMEAIETKAAACQPGDDPSADRAAVAIAAARLSAETVAEKLAAEGVDMALVETEIGKTDRPILEALVARKLDAEGVDTLRERVTAIAGAEPSEEIRRLLGFYSINAARVALGMPAPSVAAAPAPTPKSTAPVER